MFKFRFVLGMIVLGLFASCSGLVDYIREAQRTTREQNTATYKVVFTDEDTTGLFSDEKKIKKGRKEKTPQVDKSEYKKYEDKWGFQLKGTEDLLFLAELDSWLGTPYKYGGKDKTGTDCSGMVLVVYKQIYNIDCKRSAYDLWQQSKAISRNDLECGDLVFFKINLKQVSHVGIHIADGHFIHATTSRGVMINHLDEKYYADRFYQGGRIRDLK